MDKIRKQHLDGVNQWQLEQKLQDLEEEASEHKQTLAPTYAEILLKHSTYNKPHQDRLFFEHLYNTLIDILDEAFAKLQKRKQIEEEIGTLFRTQHFNVYERRNQPPRSVDTLSVKELYSIKNETLNRALNAKLLSSLYEKPPSLEVQRASLTHSPLIESFLSSPMVARSKNRGKETKAKNACLQQINSPSPTRDLKDMAPSLKVSKASSSKEGSIGLQRVGSVVLDSGGIPHDDNLNTLDDLKRTVQATLYTEISPLISAHRLANSRFPRQATTSAGEG
ncbi:hypothetical protein BSKO_13046 [Bryopsis sp. KO-2023]|nr:hypothetical protein BSKO_13046 [Bryopsis sp. KO-2023]